jgi:hypothetical protein
VDDYKAKQLPDALNKWESALKPEEIEKLPAKVAAALKTPAEKRTPQQQQLVTDQYAKSDAKLTELTRAVTDYQKKAPVQTQAQTLALGPERKTHVMVRGDFLRKGVEVSAATPAVLPPFKPAGKPSRLDLARWIVAKENPLTPRVLANWAWQKYFGRGLVATLEDFGAQGDRPTHPELLDWLALEVMDHKWSLKALHKTIVTSATYRQSSKVRPELVSRDSLNLLLARQNRLRFEAETLRDAALTASGLLVRTIGGPSVRPPQPPGISELTYAGSAKWVESQGADRYRRGLYIWFQRTSPYPMLMTFDAPDSNVCVVRRERSNTPLQALTLLNDAVFVECAQALGRRLIAEKQTTTERLERGFRLCVSRKPTDGELSRLTKLHDELLALARAKPDEAAKLAGKGLPKDMEPVEAATWTALARALLNLDEFVTRE